MSTELIGLCAACRHARGVRSARGSSFLRCALSEIDPDYPRYPRLPVLRCDGFLARDADEGGGAMPTAGTDG